MSLHRAQSGSLEAAGPSASPHRPPAPLPVPGALGCPSSLLSREAAQASSCLCQMPLCRRLLFHLHLREKEQGPRMDKQTPRGESPAAGELRCRGSRPSSRGQGSAGHTSVTQGAVSEHLSVCPAGLGEGVEAGVPAAWLHGRPQEGVW